MGKSRNRWSRTAQIRRVPIWISISVLTIIAAGTFALVGMAFTK